MAVRVDADRAVLQATNARALVNVEHRGATRRERHAIETDQERVGYDRKIDFRCEAQLTPGIAYDPWHFRRRKFPTPQSRTFRAGLDAQRVRRDKNVVLGVAAAAGRGSTLVSVLNAKRL